MKDKMPKDDRWLCTLDMSDRLLNLESKGLDDLLEHFGFERREDAGYHDAVQDCQLTAKVYMALQRN